MRIDLRSYVPGGASAGGNPPPATNETVRSLAEESLKILNECFGVNGEIESSLGIGTPGVAEISKSAPGTTGMLFDLRSSLMALRDRLQGVRQQLG